MSAQVCRRIQLDLIPLFPADLESAEAETVREHVATCAACAAELGAYAAQTARFAAAREGRRAPKLDLWEGVRAELAKPAEAPVLAFPGTFARRAFAAAAAIALLAGTFLALEKKGPQGSTDGIAVKPTPSTTSAPVPTTNATSPPTTPRGPGLAQGDAPKAPAPRALRRAPRTFFQDEGSAPFHLAQDREVLPLNEEAELPTTRAGERFKDYEAEPGARPDDARPARPRDKTKKTRATGENESLSF